VSERRRGRSASLSERELVLMRNPSHSSPLYIPGLHEREAGRRTLVPSLRFYNEMTPECRVSPIPLSQLRERAPSSPTLSFLAVPVPSNSLGIQQKSSCLGQAEKSCQPKSLKSKLKVNQANTSTTLKPISTTPVRRSFKSAVEEAVVMEEVEDDEVFIKDDEVFIKDLDLNIVHKLSLRDMPFLPAVF